MNILIDAIVNGAMLGAAYAIAGVAFGLLYRIVKVFHFAFAAIGTTGAFVAQVIAGSAPEPPAVIAGVLVGMVIAGLLTALTYIAVYRPLTRRGASSGTTFVASLAVGLIIEAGLVVAVGPGNRTFALGTFTRQVEILGLHLSGLHALALTLVVVITALGIIYMRFTGWGRRTEAIISNIEQAELVGIRSGLMSLVLCAVLGAISVLAFVVQGINSSLSLAGGIPLALFGVLAMLCGGVASILGTSIAGVLIGIVGGVAATIVPGQWSSTIVFVIAIVVVLLRPTGGNFGRRIRVKEATS